MVSLPCFAGAAQTNDVNKTLAGVAVEPNRAYFRTVEPTSVQCRYGVIYMNTNTITGRSQLSLIFLARSLGRRLSTLAYSQDADGLCWAITLEME
jgi:hypothetical protein